MSTCEDFAAIANIFCPDTRKITRPKSLIKPSQFLNAPDAADKIATTELADSGTRDSDSPPMKTVGDSELAPTKNPTGRLQLVDTTSESTQRLKLSDSHYYGNRTSAPRGCSS